MPYVKLRKPRCQNQKSTKLSMLPASVLMSGKRLSKNPGLPKQTLISSIAELTRLKENQLNWLNQCRQQSRSYGYSSDEFCRFLGGGSFGTAMANLAAKKGCDATLWVRDKRTVKSLHKLESIKIFCQIISLMSVWRI